LNKKKTNVLFCFYRKKTQTKKEEVPSIGRIVDNTTQTGQRKEERRYRKTKQKSNAKASMKQQCKVGKVACLVISNL